MAKNKQIGFLVGKDDDEDNVSIPANSKTPDHVLLQLLESIYQPADSWDSCTMPLTTERIVQNVRDHFPGKFPNREEVIRILQMLHINYQYNEHNCKWYWLVNPSSI